MLSTFSQGLPGNIVGQTLPYTWEMPFMNGKIVNTLVEDGTIYSQSITPCVLCSATGMCQVCHGTGGQFWPGMGMQPCMRCSGSGRCATCFGRGLSIMNYNQLMYSLLPWTRNNALMVDRGHQRCAQLHLIFIFFYLFTYLFVFLGPHWRHMEVLRLGVQLQL